MSGPPQRVLVAGATGYIGRRLVAELVAAGRQVADGSVERAA